MVAGLRRLVRPAIGLEVVVCLVAWLKTVHAGEWRLHRQEETLVFRDRYVIIGEWWD